MVGVGAVHSVLDFRVLGLTSVCSGPQHTMMLDRVNGCSSDYGCERCDCTASDATCLWFWPAASAALLSVTRLHHSHGSS
jgi:hypothetical protein